MEKHSLSFNEKGKNSSFNLKTNFLKLNGNNKEIDDKNNLNIVQLKFEPIMTNKQEQKINDEHKIKKNDNTKNKKYNIFKHIVPQKILNINAKPIKILKRKNISQNNIKSYENSLLDKLQLIITNSNNKNMKRNKSIDINQKNSKTKIDLTQLKKKHFIFENYKDYQKEFFSSTYNLKPKKFSTIDFNRNESFNLLNPNHYKTNINFKKKIKNKTHLINSKNYFSRPISNILKRKNHGEIPIFLNEPVTFVKNYKSNSEKERDEKNSRALLKLRDFLDIYWDKRHELITEFFSTYQINEDEYYTLKNLENFAHYIYDNINDNTNITKGIIETRMPMKEIIDKGIQYKNYSLKKLNNSKSMPIINDSEKLNLANKNIINYNLYTPNQHNNKMKYNKYIKNLFFRISSTIDKNNDENSLANCFCIDSYINNNFQISDREENQKKMLDKKTEKYRKYLDRNYGFKVNNQFMRKYNQKERINYFSKRKKGIIDIPDKDNLVNNIKKQSEFYKLKSTSFSIRKNNSILTFSENDFKELYNELNQVKQNYTILGKKKENDKNGKKIEEENVWIKMYEDIKKNKFEKHPELVLKKKKKLLEYIVFQNIKKRKDLEKDLLK